jgi:hypothetical protein
MIADFEPFLSLAYGAGLVNDAENLFFVGRPPVVAAYALLSTLLGSRYFRSE